MRRKLNEKDLLDIMQAVEVHKNLFINAYATEEDAAAKAGLKRRLEELQDLFRRVHNIRIKMVEKNRSDETEAPPPGGIRARAGEKRPQEDNTTIGD